MRAPLAGDPHPHRFPDRSEIARVLAAHDPQHMGPGAHVQWRYRLAGRLISRRGHSKTLFLDLQDRSGTIQLLINRDTAGEQLYGDVHDLDIGDIAGVGGFLYVTKRGQLALSLDSCTLLAKALHPPPDKHAGIDQIETRYRRRELDLLANDHTRRLFVDRANIVSALRSYLDGEGFVEVETPVLQPLYGGASARPFTTHYNELGQDLYLRIATELYLKRLIVGGLENVYELAKDFRNEGFSPKHSPEFTMLEFYEAYADYDDAALRLEQLVRTAARAIDYTGDIDFSSPWRRIPFIDAVKEATGIDLDAHRDAAALAAAITERGLQLSTTDAGWSQLADDLLSKFVEPTLVHPTFVLDYPLELSPFARAHPSKPGLAERWEAFIGGVELANAFSEINDPHLQRERLDAQRHRARLAHEDAAPHDELFLAALNHGMPPTAGVGIGVDRLVMILTGHNSIREVIAFPAMRDTA